MVDESTIASRSLLPTYESLYGEEGKFPVDPDTVARLRKEAEEQGLIFRGDATAGQKISEFIRNAPDAAYSFLARGAEGTAELAVALALLTYKGGRLATETDPEKLKEIMAEPSFTKYLGEFRGALGNLNLGENRLSGGSFEDMMGNIGYYAAPVPVVPVVKGAGQIAKGLASTQVGKNIVDELATTARFFPDYNPLKKFEAKSVGAMSADDVPYGNRPYPGGVKPTVIDIKDENVIKILEDFRKGNIGKIEAGIELSNLVPRSGILTVDKTASAGVKIEPKFNEIFNQYLKANKFEDIYSAKIYRSTKSKNRKDALTPQRINKILQAKRIADEDMTDATYYTKINNALENFFPTRSGSKSTYSSVDNMYYTPASSIVLDEVRAVFKYLSKTDKNIDLKLLNKPKSVKVSGLDLWNKIKINSKEPIRGDALRHLKANVLIDGSNQTFSQIKKNLLVNNKFVSDKIKKTKDLFVDQTSTQTKSIFAIDHIQPPRFGGTNLESNLRIIPQGEHLTLKTLPSSATKAKGAVKAKTGFEDDFFKEGVAIIDLIQKGNIDEAIKRGNKLDTMVDDFKSVYENTDFVVGEPHFPIKTGDKTASFVKYSDQLNLTSEQKKIVNQIFNKPEYSNRPNLGKSIEKQAEELLNTYEEIALLSGGKIGKNVSKQLLRFNKGGIVSMEFMTRPLDGQR